MTLRWRTVRGDELAAAELYDVLRLRSEVFVVEQQCLYQDIDGADLSEHAVHLLAHDADSLIAYARLLFGTNALSHSAPSTPQARIGRVIVAGRARGRGLARDLVRRALTECGERWPGRVVALSAQAHLVDFYASMGFEALSEPYDEDGIPHVDMTLTP